VLEGKTVLDVGPGIGIFSIFCTQAETTTVDKITAQLYITIVEKSEIYPGVSFRFDVQFPTTDTTLSTSPSLSITHWKQTIVLPTQIEVEEGDAVMFNVQLQRNSSNLRHYSINLDILDILDSQHKTHPNPCNCYQTKCKSIIDDEDKMTKMRTDYKL